MSVDRDEKRKAITFRLCATIHFNRAIDKGTDYVMPGGYAITLANDNIVQFDFNDYEGSINSDGCSVNFMQKNPDYESFEALNKLTVEDLRSFKEFNEFYIYLGENGESEGLEVTKITDAYFQVISDESGSPCYWLDIDIPDEKIPEKAYR